MMSTEKKMKTFIVKRTMPTYVTISFEVEAENEKEACDKYMGGDYNTPVGPVEIGATLKVEPTIDVKEKGEQSKFKIGFDWPKEK